MSKINLKGNETSVEDDGDDIRLLFSKTCDESDQDATSNFWTSLRDTLHRRIGLLYGVLTAITISLQFSFVKILSEKFPAEELMFWRSLFMFVILPRVSWEKSLEYEALDLLLYFLYGFLNFGGIYITFLALQYTDIGSVHAIAVNLTIPTAIFANLFLGESVSLRKLILFFINCVGIILVADPSDIFSENSSIVFEFYGCCLAFIALISLTLSRIVARKSSLRGAMDASLMTVMTGVVGTPLCFIIAMLPLWPLPSSFAEWLTLAIYVVLALFSNQFAMNGLKTESASSISALTSLSVVLAYMAGFLYFDDDVKPLAFFGTALVLGSTFGSLLEE